VFLIGGEGEKGVEVGGGKKEESKGEEDSQELGVDEGRKTLQPSRHPPRSEQRASRNWSPWGHQEKK